MGYHAETLAQYVCNLSYGDLPKRVVQQAKWCILDCLGVSLAGCQTAWAKSVLDLTRDQGGKEEATIYYYGDRTSSANAALANSVFAHSVDFDDDLAVCHTGAIATPTALAIGERVAADGRDLITAVVLGYDIATRVADALDAENVYLRGLQPTALCGPFAAAAIAGKLLHLSEEEMAHAFGIAASFSGGTVEFLKHGTDTKRLYPGKGAMGGIVAALLAQTGMTGPKSIFEGEQGFLKAHSASSQPAKLIQDLGARYDILDVSIKRFPFCDGIAAPFEAIIHIIEENDLGPDDIADIKAKIKSFLYLVVDHRGDPQRTFPPKTVLDAQLSLPFCAAVGILNGGDIFLDDFRADVFTDARVLDLAKRIKAEPDPELDKIPYRPMSMPAVVTLTTTGGKSFEKRVDYQKGDPRNPFEEKDYHAKFSRCASTVLSEDRVEELIALVSDLERLANVSELAGKLVGEDHLGQRAAHQ